MANARVARGRRTEVVVARWLREHGWPRAESRQGAHHGKDVFYVEGHAIEVKARYFFDPQAWLRQSKKNACPGETPCVIVRFNGQGENASEYLVFRRLEDDELNLL
jgi:hypothetical protein